MLDFVTIPLAQALLSQMIGGLSDRLITIEVLMANDELANTASCHIWISVGEFSL